MDIYVCASTYNSYGGNRTLSLLAPFFKEGAANFGPDLTTLEITFHFAHPGPPTSTLEDLFERFHANLQTLPRFAYRRSREKAEISFQSKLMTGADLDQKGPPSLEWFRRGAVEMVEHVALLQSRFKTTDHFDFSSFLAHCRARLLSLPSNDQQFQLCVQRFEQTERKRHEALSDWDKLGIDFRDYHRNARTILDEPFYWDCADDFAPNGNDTGADLLANYREWLSRNKQTKIDGFLQKVLADTTPKSADPIEQQLFEESIVALAFADIKLCGTCDPQVAQLATAVINQQLEHALQATTDNLTEEFIETRKKLAMKLAPFRQRSALHGQTNPLTSTPGNTPSGTSRRTRTR